MTDTLGDDADDGRRPAKRVWLGEAPTRRAGCAVRSASPRPLERTEFAPGKGAESTNLEFHSWNPFKPFSTTPVLPPHTGKLIYSSNIKSPMLQRSEACICTITAFCLETREFI